MVGRRSLQLWRSGAATTLTYLEVHHGTHRLELPGGRHPPEQHDHGCVSANVEIVFRNHRKRLLRLFQEAREEGLVCLGAVAWLTDFEVLDAMATLPSSVVVQKEDFLRPDSPTGAGGQRDGWRDVLREHYTAVAESARHDPGFCRYNFPPPLGDMSLLGDHTIAGGRCVGARNARGAGGNRQQPLMHHKYLVFAKLTFPLAPGHEGKEDPPAEPFWAPASCGPVPAISPDWPSGPGRTRSSSGTR